MSKEIAQERERFSRLLIVEDDPNQAKTLVALLQEEGFEVHCSRSAEEALSMIDEFSFGIAIVDLKLPHLSGTEFLEQVRANSPQIQVIIHTGFASFDSAKEAINLNAYAYVEKGEDPVKLVRHVYGAFWNLTQLYTTDLETAVKRRTNALQKANRALRNEIAKNKRSELALGESENRFRSVVEYASDSIWEIDVEGNVLYSNSVIEKTLGCKLSEFVGSPLTRFAYDEAERAKVASQLKIAKQQSKGWHNLLYQLRHSDGRLIILESHGEPNINSAGQLVGFREIARDITRQRSQEIALRESEARYRSLVNLSPFSIIVHVDGKIVFSNSEAIACLGAKSVETLKGMPIDEIVVSGSLDVDRLKAGEPLMEGVNSPTSESRFIRCDESVIDVEFRSSTIDYYGQQAIQTVFQDITNRKKSELMLRVHSEAISATQSGVVITDARQPGQPIIFCNPAFEAITRFSFAEIEGQSTRFLYRNDTAQAGLKLLSEAQHRGVECQVVLRSYQKDGTIFWNESTWAPVRNHDNELTHWVGILVDITNRVRAEETTRQTNQELAHVSRLRTMGELVAEIAHEVNQPLYAISNYATTCSNVLSSTRGDRNTIIEKCSREITAQADRAGTIIRRMREFASKTQPVHSPHQITDVIQESVGLIEPLARKHSIEVEINSSPNLPLISMDKVQIQQVLVNLLTNAYQAMETDPQNCSIVVISAQAIENNLLVSVIDNGPGIPVVNCDDVFAAFESTKQEGLGMGLAISRRIIEDHSGRIWAEPSKSGAKFLFTLPLDGANLLLDLSLNESC